MARDQVQLMDELGFGNSRLLATTAGRASHIV